MDIGEDSDQFTSVHATLEVVRVAVFNTGFLNLVNKFWDASEGRDSDSYYELRHENEVEITYFREGVKYVAYVAVLVVA